MEEMNESKKKKYKIIRIIIQIILLILILTAVIYLTIKFYPIFIKINEDEVYRNEVVEKIRSYGIWSSMIIILILPLYFWHLIESIVFLRHFIVL